MQQESSVMWPCRLDDPTDESRKKWPWSLLVQMLRSSERWPLPKRKRSRDEGRYGRRLAPRGPRAAKFSGVWRQYPSTRRLLSAHGKQQVCCRFGTFGPAGRMDQAALARRGDHSRILHRGDAWGLGLDTTFPAGIPNSL